MDELESSELGTQDYWEHFYGVEAKNFKSHGDEGEIWFGKGVSQRIVSYIATVKNLDRTSRIIDIGCGNGQLSMAMADAGFINITAVDYSKNAIALAQDIAKEGGYKNISFKVVDILNSDSFLMSNKFKIAIDKGTYDAISLCPDNSKLKRQIYIQLIHNLLDVDGIFILTSCNWTLEEIKKQFKSYFNVDDIIPNPTFMFGGKEGQTVTSAVFKSLITDSTSA